MASVLEAPDEVQPSWYYSSIQWDTQTSDIKTYNGGKFIWLWIPKFVIICQSSNTLSKYHSLVFFSILGVILLSKKICKARLMEDPSLTPYLLHTELYFIDTSWRVLIYFQCYNLLYIILVFSDSFLIGPPLSLQCVLVLKANIVFPNLNITSCSMPPYNLQ